MAADTGVEWIIETDPVSGLATLAFPKEPTGPVLLAGADPVQSAIDFLLRYPGVFGVTRAEQLQLVERHADPDGISRVRLAQVAGGKPVDSVQLLLTFDADGGVSHVSGPFFPTLEVIAAAAPAITEAEAEAVVRREFATRVEPVFQRSGPVTQRIALARTTRQPILVYVLPVTTADNAYDALVDAQSGAFEVALPLRQQKAVTGAGWDGTSRTFNIDEPVDGAYRMRRARAGNRPAIEVYDGSSAPSYQEAGDAIAAGSASLVSSSSADQWEQDRSDDDRGTAVDVMAYLQTVDTWWRTHFGRASFDGQGTAIKASAYVRGFSSANAYFSDAPGNPHFGFTGGDGGVPFTDLETVGHEFMHAVIARTSKLEYQGESGGLNESVADIFGEFVALEAGVSNPQDVGDEYNYVIRSFSNPKGADPSLPDTYQEAESSYLNSSADHYGVHSTSSVSNVAWYLMTFGGSHPSSGYLLDGKPLGVEVSRKLWWAIARELKSTSSFKDAAKASLLAARYLKLEDRTPVGCAWYAVGVFTEDELKKNYKIECPGTGTNNDLGTACGGRDAGWYCTALEARASYRCDGNSAMRQEIAYCKPTESCVTTGAGTVGCE